MAMKNANSKKLEGAEAVLTPLTFGPFAALDKIRLSKAYRPSVLDEKIRTSRTRVEARLLTRAKAAGVPCPLVLAVGPYDIVMKRVDGKTLNAWPASSITAEVWTQAGTYLARLHKAGIIHGDYTPANLMWDGEKEKTGKYKKKETLTVIDFGLGNTSGDDEDFAVDVLTMKKALHEEKSRKSFLSGYRKEGDARVLKHMEEVEKRARYQDRGG